VSLEREGNLCDWESSTRESEDKEERYPISHLLDPASPLFHSAFDMNWCP